ncbi:tetratricopeptide repeat protein [Segetibacter koreensis]|uniref:tetratricopeptide repeat protein n=1 Tax=Segetibacter koreensis TaxID=398037 RepID=UPI000375116C|nr:tetratricopeptide repeat protein [Segetibacter koreensis]
MKRCVVFIIISLVIFSCGQNDKNETVKDADHLQLLDQLKAGVKQYPDSAGARMRLINTYDSLKMYKDAISQTDSLIKRDSLNNGLWFTKAQLQEDNKDTASAIDSYTKAINIYPSTEAQLHLANLFAETKNPKALIVCENVRKLGMGRETDADCNFIAGIYYARTGADKQALQLFDKAINDNYTLMEAYMEKGFIYYDNKNYPEALKVFETATTVNNTYADAYYWRAKCREALGNKAEAILDYKRSLGLDNQLKEAAEAVKRLE